MGQSLSNFCRRDEKSSGISTCPTRPFPVSLSCITVHILSVLNSVFWTLKMLPWPKRFALIAESLSLNDLAARTFTRIKPVLSREMMNGFAVVW